MVSIQAKITALFLPLLGFKTFLDDPDKVDAKLAKLRAKGPDLPKKRHYKDFDITESERDGYRVFRIAPKDGQPKRDKHILFFHGGAYVWDMSWAHWGLVTQLVRLTGRTITVPIYPLAPENKCEALIPAMQSLYLDMAKDFGAGTINVMGDSAGAGLTLAMAHSLRDGGYPLPENLTLLSPWLDAEGSDPRQPALSEKDPMLALHTLSGFADMYRGDLPITDPRVSPLYGEHHGLPPIQVYAGTADTLYPDALRFMEAVHTVDTQVEFISGDGMFHDWMILMIPEAKKTQQQIAEFLN